MRDILKKIKRTFNKLQQQIVGTTEQQAFEAQDLQLEDVLESMSDGFFALDRNWVVRYYNKAAEKMLMPRELVINKNLWDVFSDAIDSTFYQQYQRVMNEGISASFEEYYPTLNLWAQIRACPSANGIVIYFRDITENKRQLSINALEIDVLTHYTGKGSTIESTLQLMLEGIRGIHPELLCSVLKVDQNKLKYFYSHLPAPFIEATNHADITKSCGCLGVAALSGDKTSFLDITDDPAWENYRQLALDYQLKACVFYPLFDPWQKVIGLFTIYLKTPRALSPAEETTLQKSKYILAHILQNHIAEESLKISEGKYRQLFNLHPLPLWLYDTETYRFLDVNEASIRHYGYSREEFLSMTIKDIRPAEDLPELEKTLVDTQTSGSYSLGTFRHRKKNGDLIYVEVRSNPVESEGNKARLIISTDVTGKVETERALNLSEQRFKALVHEGSDLINIIDLNGAYIYASPASAAMFCKHPEEVIGTHPMHFIHEEDREMLGKALTEIKTTRRLQTPPYRFRLQNGEYRWLQSIGTNLLEDPAVKGIVMNSRDITDSVNYIQAIEAQNAKLRDIAWTQSHVVRAPLSRIMGLLELIRENPESPQLHAELLDHVLNSADELDQIIRNIVSQTEQVKYAYSPNLLCLILNPSTFHPSSSNLHP
jgi:PAS domain S-box-containing protein